MVNQEERNYPKAVLVIGVAVTIFLALMVTSKDAAIAILFVGGFTTWILSNLAGGL